MFDRQATTRTRLDPDRPAAAARGAGHRSSELETLDGGKKNVTINPGTQPNDDASSWGAWASVTCSVLAAARY